MKKVKSRKWVYTNGRKSQLYEIEVERWEGASYQTAFKEHTVDLPAGIILQKPLCK
jgi:hypothetical protein